MTDSVFKANLAHPVRAPRPFAAVAAAFGRWRDRTASLRELGRLDDLALRDIGVARHEIAAVIDARLAQRRL